MSRRALGLRRHRGGDGRCWPQFWGRGRFRRPSVPQVVLPRTDLAFRISIGVADAPTDRADAPPPGTWLTSLPGGAEVRAGSRRAVISPTLWLRAPLAPSGCSPTRRGRGSARSTGTCGCGRASGGVPGGRGGCRRHGLHGCRAGGEDGRLRARRPGQPRGRGGCGPRRLARADGRGRGGSR